MIEAYVANAHKMMKLYVDNDYNLVNDNYIDEQLHAASKLLTVIQTLLSVNIIVPVENIENGILEKIRNAKWLFPVICLLDVYLLFIPKTPENGLKLISINNHLKTPFSYMALKLFLSSNWLSNIESKHTVSNHGLLPLPALYWACFVKHGYIKYQD